MLTQKLHDFTLSRVYSKYEKKKQGIEIDPLMIYIPITTTIIKCPS